MILTGKHSGFSMVTDRDGAAFAEGIEAYSNGLPRFACPYAPDTSEYREWMRGWDEVAWLDIEDHADWT
jgi:ribosome modulation factor